MRGVNWRKWNLGGRPISGYAARSQESTQSIGLTEQAADLFSDVNRARRIIVGQYNYDVAIGHPCIQGSIDSGGASGNAQSVGVSLRKPSAGRCGGEVGDSESTGVQCVSEFQQIAGGGITSTGRTPSSWPGIDVVSPAILLLSVRAITSIATGNIKGRILRFKEACVFHSQGAGYPLFHPVIIAVPGDLFDD